MKKLKKPKDSKQKLNNYKPWTKFKKTNLKKRKLIKNSSFKKENSRKMNWKSFANNLNKMMLTNMLASNS